MDYVKTFGEVAIRRKNWVLRGPTICYVSGLGGTGTVDVGYLRGFVALWEFEFETQDAQGFDTVLAAQEWVETMCSEAEALREMHDTMEQFTRLWGLV